MNFSSQRLFENWPHSSAASLLTSHITWSHTSDKQVYVAERRSVSFTAVVDRSSPIDHSVSRTLQDDRSGTGGIRCPCTAVTLS